MSVSTAPTRTRLIDEHAAVSSDGASLSVCQIQQAIEATNSRLSKIGSYRGDVVDVFSIIDFRMLSGLVGEMVALSLHENVPTFRKNPHIDGYPDLCSVSSADAWAYYRKHTASTADLDVFRKFRYGGIEVKNTFGTKKSSQIDLVPGTQRVGAINRKLDWKAHHRETNNLLGLLSDFIGGTPQVVAAFFANDLNEDDWSEKHDPKLGSTMTSFCVIGTSGFNKMVKGLRLCVDDRRYGEMLGVTERAWQRALVVGG